jgi:hypothetical protein
MNPFNSDQYKSRLIEVANDIVNAKCKQLSNEILQLIKNNISSAAKHAIDNDGDVKVKFDSISAEFDMSDREDRMERYFHFFIYHILNVVNKVISFALSSGKFFFHIHTYFIYT